MYASDTQGKSDMQTPSYSSMTDSQAPSYSNMAGTGMDFTSDRPTSMPSYSENIWSAQNYNFGSSQQKEQSFSEDVTSSWMPESIGNYNSMFSGDRKRSHSQTAYDYGSVYPQPTAAGSYDTSRNWSDYDLEASGPKKNKVSSTGPKREYSNASAKMEDVLWSQGQGGSYQGNGSTGRANRRQQSQQPDLHEEGSEIPSNWGEIKTLLTHLAKHKSLSKLLGDASNELFQEEMTEESYSGPSSFSGGQNYGRERSDYGRSDQWHSSPRPQNFGNSQRGRGRAKQTGRGQSTSQYGQGHTETGGHYGQGRGQYGQGRRGQGRGQFERGRGRGTGRGSDHHSSNYISSGLSSGQRGTGSRGRGQRGRGQGQQDENASSNFVTSDGQSSRGRGFGSRGRGQFGRGQEGSGRGSFRGDRRRGGSMPSGRFRGMGRGHEGSQNTRFAFGGGEKTTKEKLEYLRDRLKSNMVAGNNPISRFHEAINSGELKLQHVYNCEESVRFQQKPMYSGSLEVCSTFIVRCMGRNKKTLKMDVYTQATDRLKTVPINEILPQSDPGLNAVNDRLTKLEELGIEGSVDLNAVIGELIHTKKPLNENLKADLSSLRTYMRGGGNIPQNPISLFEQAFQACHVKCSHKFVLTEASPGVRPKFSGALVLADVVLGQGSAQTKKECKQLAYGNAESSLKIMPITEIMNGKTVEEFEQRGILSAPTIQGTVLSSAVATGNQSTLTYKLDMLSRSVQKATAVIHNMTNLDSLIFTLDLIPTIIYYKKKMPDGTLSLFCDFYINDLFISSAADTGFKNRKEAHTSSYSNAWTILAATGGSTLTKNKTLTDEIRNGKDVVECIVKGKGRAWNTNKSSLRRLNVDPFNPPKEMSALLIMQRTEFAVDLPKFAFGILLYSATMCEMLIDCDIVHEKGMFNCKIILQNEELAAATGKSKAVARNGAAYQGICKLVQNGNTVVETSRSEDTLMWTTWQDIYKTSQELRKRDGAKEVPITDFKDHMEFDPSLISEPPDKYVVQAVTDLIKGSLEKDTLQEVIVGPGMPGAEIHDITQAAKGMGLRVDQRHAGNRQYYSFYNRYQPDTMIPLLNKHQGKLGRFTLCLPARAKAMWKKIITESPAS